MYEMSLNRLLIDTKSHAVVMPNREFDAKEACNEISAYRCI